MAKLFLITRNSSGFGGVIGEATIADGDIVLGTAMKEADKAEFEKHGQKSLRENYRRDRDGVSRACRCRD
jgi:hypothetical protein